MGNIATAKFEEWNQTCFSDDEEFRFSPRVVGATSLEARSKTVAQYVKDGPREIVKTGEYRRCGCRRPVPVPVLCDECRPDGCPEGRPMCLKNGLFVEGGPCLVCYKCGGVFIHVEMSRDRLMQEFKQIQEELIRRDRPGFLESLQRLDMSERMRLRIEADRAVAPDALDLLIERLDPVSWEDILGRREIAAVYADETSGQAVEASSDDSSEHADGQAPEFAGNWTGWTQLPLFG